MAAYYNEIDAYAAQWLRNLIAAGHIAPGDVDTRSIAEVSPDDLRGYTQCHFFAGIGGWSRALRLAGWDDDRPVWTGSCPCQPFSVAGKQVGFDDPRHLWPQFKRLISERLPSIVFGEQVAGASDWLGLVRGDLEGMGYAVGAIPMEAASAGADHFRDRYWFVADRDLERASTRRLQRSRQLSGAGCDPQDHSRAVADDDGCSSCQKFGNAGEVRSLPEAQCQPEHGPSVPRGGCDRPLVNDPLLGWGEGWTESEFRRRGFTAAVASIDGVQFIECPDGKWLRLPPPRVRWLGNGVPARVAKLRALGNAIDPRPAAEFIRAAA